MAEKKWRIALDAGHGGADPGSVYQGRQEKEDVQNLALSVGNILTDRGFDVVYTRTEDTYESPYEKAEIANRSGADVLISLHRNSMQEPNTGSGAEALVYQKTGKAGKIAEILLTALQMVGFVNLGVTERPGLALLKYTKMPAVLLEVGFVDSEEDNRLYDSKFPEIASAVADGVEKSMEQAEPGEVLYRVQVGAFRARELAEQLLVQLESQGFPAFLVYEDGFYKVQVGAFAHLDNAVRMEQTLRQFGYNTYITK